MSDDAMQIKDRGLAVIADYIGKLGKDRVLAALYRGHSDSSWEIRPSAFRHGTYGIVVKEHLNDWRAMASRFVVTRPQNQFEWLVLAQHYGVATPLLDWTTNPLVALFFACMSNDRNADGCVIEIERTRFQTLNSPETVDVFKKNRVLPVLIDASAMNARTLAQDSAMSVHSALDPVVPFADDCRVIYKVRKRDKHHVALALRMFGFSPERVFSDITVAAREFAVDLENDHVFSFRSLASDRAWPDEGKSNPD